MKPVGAKIERIRKLWNLSREDLANRLGLTAQTVLNIERDPTYNLGVDLLIKLEKALSVTIEITFKEHEMNPHMNISSAHLIHQLRENNQASQVGNKELGKKIRLWMKAHGIEPSEWDAPVIWPIQEPEVSEFHLPKTSAKYQISASLLPELYAFIFTIGQRLENTISEAEWLEILDNIRQHPSILWRLEGENDFVREGRITNYPAESPSQWSPLARIFIGMDEIGEPVLIGHIRSLKRLRAE